MLLTGPEYHEARRRFTEEALNIGLLEKRLRKMHFKNEEIERAIVPRIQAQRALSRQIEFYERLACAGSEVEPSRQSVGKALVALRLMLGLSHRELAGVLGTTESYVVDGERSNWRGISKTSACRMLETLRALEERESTLQLLRTSRARSLPPLRSMCEAKVRAEV